MQLDDADYCYNGCMQDMSFFDNETVGDLTSRLGSDCQQLSRVIGHDLTLISRSIIQVNFFVLLISIFQCYASLEASKNLST